MQAHTGGRMLANTCLHTHTHCWWNLYSLLWTITQILIPVLHPSISSCVHSHPPLRDVFKKKNDSFPAGLRNLPCLIWHISLTHILFPSLHLPRSLLLAMHKQSSSHSGSPVFAFPPTLFYPIHLPSSLFFPAKQLMSLPVWETYGKRLVTAWRMWRRVKEDGVLTPMCETQSITDFFLTLSGVKQVLSKQFTRPHRHLWGVITQCCSCLITLRGFCNADEGLFYFLHYSHISILQKLNKTASAELRWHRIDL